MRLRTTLRERRGALGLNAAARRIGVSAGDLSRIERGLALPTDEQARAMVAVYGPVDGWYALRPTILPDAACDECGKPLPPGSSSRRRFHGERCRSRFRRR